MLIHPHEWCHWYAQPLEITSFNFYISSVYLRSISSSVPFMCSTRCWCIGSEDWSFSFKASVMNVLFPFSRCSFSLVLLFLVFCLYLKFTCFFQHLFLPLPTFPLIFYLLSLLFNFSALSFIFFHEFVINLFSDLADTSDSDPPFLYCFSISFNLFIVHLFIEPLLLSGPLDVE